jgi:hypothetical protein
MAEYPYVKVQEKLKKYLQHIQTAGIPTKVSQEYLKSAGFTSSNDLKILGVLRSIGFIDNSGTPSEDYKNYRNTRIASQVLGDAIKQGYSELFAMYPNANQQDGEALRNFFSSHTTAGGQVISAMVSTFNTLCAEANFEVAAIPPVAEVRASPAPSHANPARILDTQSLTVNVQITLPETTNSDVYKEIFKAMRMHLIERGE